MPYLRTFFSLFAPWYVTILSLVFTLLSISLCHWYTRDAGATTRVAEDFITPFTEKQHQQALCRNHDSSKSYSAISELETSATWLVWLKFWKRPSLESRITFLLHFCHIVAKSRLDRNTKWSLTLSNCQFSNMPWLRCESREW